MLFHRILSFFLAFIIYGCSDGELPMANLSRSQTSDMITTSHALGSFIGNKVANLQQDQLVPGEYTIQFQVVEPPIDGLGFAAYAYIIWKVEGQQLQRIVSVFNGSAITGVADSVHVQLLDQSERGSVFLQGFFTVTNGSPIFTSTVSQSLKAGQLIQFNSQPGVFYTVISGMTGLSGELDRPYTGPGGPGALAFTLSSYKIGATLSKGTRPTTMQPAVLLTTSLRTVPPGNSFTFPFPPSDAGVLSMLATVSVDGANDQAQANNGVIQLVSAAGLVLASFNPLEFPAWYPIPPGTTTVQAFNRSVVNTLDFSIQWGIEG